MSRGEKLSLNLTLLTATNVQFYGFIFRSRLHRDAALGAGDSAGRLVSRSDADLNAANPLLHEHKDESGE